MIERAGREMRVLVLAITEGDAELSETILREAGMTACICANIDQLRDELEVGAGAVVVTDDGLAAGDAAKCLIDALARQPNWSDIPTILLCGSGADSPLAGWAMENLGGVTVLERPVRITTIVSALRTSIAARRRQYELRDQLAALRKSEESLRSANQRLTLLWEAAAILLSMSEPEEMLEALFTKIATPLQLDVYFNFLIQPGVRQLQLHRYAGIAEDVAKSIAKVGFDETICGTVAARRKPLVATFLQQSEDPRAQLAKGLGIRVYACNPLLAGDRLLGTLSFASRRRDEFDPHEIEFLETVSHYVTLAYQRTQFVRALRENDRRKDEFLATLAHELRNPLAPIRAGLELMKLSGGSQSIIDDIRPTMERQLQQMVHLIDDLMDVSRITRGKLSLRQGRVELAAVVYDAVDATRSFFDELNHKLTVSLPNDPVFIGGDPTRLAQVLTNLLSNGAKYTPAGGHVELTAERHASEVFISIKDDGIGIPAAMQERIFDMFAQVDTPPERPHGGLGIGLTLVRSIIEMHGGSIEVYSEGPGKGSEFVVRLPLLTTASPPDVQAQDGQSAGPCPKHRVLVVDDNHDAARLLSMHLRVLGSEVFTASDGYEAVHVAAEVRPDIVLMDIGMPGMNGYDAARRMRSESWGKELLLIALTGWGQEEDKQRAAAAGFDHHLVKPLEPAALRTLLASR